MMNVLPLIIRGLTMFPGSTSLYIDSGSDIHPDFLHFQKYKATLERLNKLTGHRVELQHM